MDDNIHNLRDALEWLDRRIREEAEYDGEMTNEHAIQLGFITNMLERFPLRQCDVGTAEEQEERYLKFKREHVDRMARCPAVWYSFFPDSLYWAQTPYEEEGGGEE